MSTTAVKQPVAPVPSEPMTVHEFARSPEYDDKRFELIDGYIVRREEMKPAHAGATESLRHRRLGASGRISRFGFLIGPSRYLISPWSVATTLCIVCGIPSLRISE
jgi:hypothetical protein